MFTGIISGIGSVAHIDLQQNFLIINSSLFSQKELKLGASVAIDGVCLSVTKLEPENNYAHFELGEETKNLTLLGQKKPSELVNIELSLRVGDPLDGHIVQGHIDALAQLKNKNIINNSLILDFKYSSSIQDLLIPKGCVALNGVSLTLNSVNSSSFSVCLIPITRIQTNLENLSLGDEVHVETDMFCRYMRNYKRLGL